MRGKHNPKATKTQDRRVYKDRAELTNKRRDSCNRIQSEVQRIIGN